MIYPFCKTKFKNLTVDDTKAVTVSIPTFAAFGGGG